MDGVIRLTLPEPPSANRYWRTFRGRAVKSAEARAFVATVHGLAKAAKIKPITTGPVAVDITWVRGRKAGDLDNRLKIVLDALGKGLCYKDDRQITEITMHRQDGTAPGKLEVSVWALE